MSDYLVVSLARDAPLDHDGFQQLKASAVASAATVNSLTSRTLLITWGPVQMPTLTVGPWTLIGRVFHRINAPLSRVSNDDPWSYEKKMLARFWGRFIGIRLDAAGCVAAALRDPSGALEGFTWTDGPITIVASDLPAWAFPILRPQWTIDFDRVDAALHDPFLAEAALLLDGPQALLPGTMQDLPDGPTTMLWHPAWLARHPHAVSDEDAAEILRNAVDEAVSNHARQDRTLAAEISGGLDSSTVAATLARHDKAQVRLWLNAWGPDASADERPWVDALAVHIGIEATSIPRSTGRVSQSFLENIPQGVRPGLAALDMLHDADWARRFMAANVQMVLTGKGGDALFVQPADLGVFADLWNAHGWRATASPSLYRLARWNDRSIWSLIANARRPSRPREGGDLPNGLLAARRSNVEPAHPWLAGIEDLGPAKRRQIAGLIQGVGFHGPSLQTQVVSVVHPLLCQPVVEACLSLPTPQLTLGRRDRGLARHAFSDRLPSPITTRRSKGEMTAFYGRMIADGLDDLRPWLLDGRLADHGLIDRAAADTLLTRESLAWRGGYVDVMFTAAIEGWVRAWERRLTWAR